MMLVSIVSIALISVLVVICVIISLWKKLNVTLTLAGGMIFIFVSQAILFPDLITQNISFWDVYKGSGNAIAFHDELGFTPALIVDSPIYIYTIITAIFTHADIFHLFFNVIFLIFLGLPLEKKIGGFKLLLVFIVSGIIGHLFTSSLGLFEFLGASIYSTGVGASGGIYGIMGCFFILYPNEKIFFPLVLLTRWPVWVVTLAYFLLSVLFWALSSDIKDYHVGNDVHIGGLVGGILLGLALKAAPGTSKAKVKLVDEGILKKLATTMKLKDILAKIEKEDKTDIKKIWLEEFAKNLKCRDCKKMKMRYDNERFECGCGKSIVLK